MSLTISEYLAVSEHKELKVKRHIAKEAESLNDMATKGGGNFNQKNDYNALAEQLAAWSMVEYKKNGEYPEKITLGERTVWDLLRPNEKFEDIKESVVNNLGHTLVNKAKGKTTLRRISFISKVNHQKRADNKGYMYKFYIIPPNTEKVLTPEDLAKEVIGNDAWIKEHPESVDIIDKLKGTVTYRVPQKKTEKETEKKTEKKTELSKEETEAVGMIDYILEENSKLRSTYNVYKALGKSIIEIKEKLLDKIKV